jgi:hypothetical protein
MSAQLSRPTIASSPPESVGDPNPGFIVVDASVWVSRLVPKDVIHQMVKAWIEKQRSEGDIFLSPALLLPKLLERFRATLVKNDWPGMQSTA